MDYTLVTQLARAIHRPWHIREQNDADLHPSVEHALKQARPKNWHLVVLQWPHVAEDNLRLAYTQSDRKGEANLQTVTSIGKYLKAHWPNTPDHTIRDWVATYCPDEFEIRTTQLEIVSAAELGPRSCMCSQSQYANFPFTRAMHEALSDGAISDDDLDCHPYSVYSPEYGWAVAVRLQDGKIVGRALVNGKNFVRSYCLPEGAGRSETDYKLEAWLNKQGYTEKSRWPEGTKLRDINHPDEDGPLMPYLDGNTTTISFHRQGHWEIDSKGDHECDNTDGTATNNEKESIGDCEDCGDTIYDGDDDWTMVGYYEETMVCSCCANNYTRVRGANLSRQTSYYNRPAYREYYVHDDNAAQVKGAGYCVDMESLPPDVVELESGDYAESDDVVCIEDEYYMLSDYRVVPLARDFSCESYALHENTWVDGNGERYHDGEDHWTDYNGDKWLTDEETPVEVDGELWRESELESVRNAAQVAPLFAEMP